MIVRQDSAVLFDIDGTLVDSNYLHIQAWSEILAELGHPVDAWRIHRAIGMDSAKLLSNLLGDADATSLGDEAKAGHAAAYEKLAPRLRLFRDARELVQTLVGHGIQVVLATSAPESELKHLRKVLDLEDFLAEITSDEDVKTAKPAPDILQVALQKTGVPADRAMMIGDAVWDARAAGAAGMTFVGLRSGGSTAGQLTAAGAVAVYDDPADLLARLDRSPLAALWS